MVGTTQSQLVLKISWDSERTARSDFVLGREKSPLDDTWQKGQLADPLDAFVMI
jgi:hypothetical protein